MKIADPVLLSLFMRDNEKVQHLSRPLARPNLATIIQDKNKEIYKLPCPYIFSFHMRNRKTIYTCKQCWIYTCKPHSPLTCPVAVAVGALQVTCQLVLSTFPCPSILSNLWCCLSISSSSVFLSFFLLWPFLGTKMLNKKVTFKALFEHL